MQRDIKAILVAHKIDPKRRELYVEGRRDRSFFLWFLGDERDPDTSIFAIDSVRCDVPVEGGCRGRLLTFAASIRPHNLQVRNVLLMPILTAFLIAPCLPMYG